MVCIVENRGELVYAFLRCCWRTHFRSHVALFRSSFVSKSPCVRPEPTGEAIIAALREIPQLPVGGYRRFRRRSLRTGSPTVSPDAVNRDCLPRELTKSPETVRGIVRSGSLVCQRIAAHAPVLAAVEKGAQRVIRMGMGVTTKRSPDLDAAHLTAQLRTQAVAHLRAAAPHELWLLADGSDLRKPYAKQMPHVMKVRALDKRLVPGYRTLTVLGVTPQWRGIFYQRLFSSTEPGFVSEPHETQQALQTVSQALGEFKPQQGACARQTARAGLPHLDGARCDTAVARHLLSALVLQHGTGLCQRTA